MVPVAKQNNIKKSIHIVIFATGISIKKLRPIVKYNTKNVSDTNQSNYFFLSNFN